MKHFEFNTGVTIENNPNGPLGGKLAPNGIWVIPFEITEDIPDGSELMYLAPIPDADITHSLRCVALVKPSAMHSDYAYFRVR